MKFLSDMPKFLSSCICAAVLTFFILGCIWEGQWVGVCVFFLLDCFFVYNLLIRGSVVCIDTAHVEQRFLGWKMQSWLWSEIAEAGIINDKYMYLSPVKLDEEQRLALCLQWPQKGKICFLAGQSRQEQLKAYLAQWGDEVVMFTTHRIKPL